MTRDNGLAALLAADSIRLAESATDQVDAIRQTGQALIDAGAIDPPYIDSMLKREVSVSTFMGDGIAIPHGTLSGKNSVLADALVVLRFPDGVEWNGERVFVTVGLAARGNGHIALLSQLAAVLLEPDAAAALRAATTPDEVYRVLTAEVPSP